MVVPLLGKTLEVEDSPGMVCITIVIIIIIITATHRDIPASLDVDILKQRAVPGEIVQSFVRDVQTPL